MLKGVGFKLQVQLTAEKGKQFLPYSIDRELGSIDRKSQEKKFYRFSNQAQARENI